MQLKTKIKNAQVVPAIAAFFIKIWGKKEVYLWKKKKW